MRRDVAIEIFAPTEGLHHELGRTMITPRSTPNVSNCNAYFGAVQKEYGTSLFATGTTPGGINFIYESPFAGNSTLQVFTNTGMYKYGSGTYGDDGQVYTGATADYWNGCMYIASNNDAFIYTNAVDTIQAKYAYNSTGTAMAGCSYKARAVVSFYNHLNIYHSTEGGTGNPKRVRWTKIGSIVGTGSDFSTAGSGYVDLMDVDGDILTAGNMGQGAVAIYSEGCVHIQQWVGGSDVYRFTKTISNITIPSRRCFVQKDDIHYVLTADGLYRYAGGSDWTCVSDPIKEDFSSTINKANLACAHLQYIKEDESVYMYVPTGTSSVANTCYIYKIDDESWWSTSRPYSASGRFTRASGITIGDLVGDIGAQTWKFGDLRTTAGSPVYLMGDPTGAKGRVVQLDKTRYSIMLGGVATAQTFVFDTKDIVSVKDIDPLLGSKVGTTQYRDDENRWLACVIEAKGSGSMMVEYSVDGGSTFIQFPESPVALAGDWTMYRLDMDTVSERMLIRVSNSVLNEVVHLRYIKLEFLVGAEGGARDE